MKKAVASTLVGAQLLVFWFAAAETKTDSRTRTDLLAGSEQPGPVITVSPGVLDFGLVGVKRTKALTLTLRNVSGGPVKGKATVTAPFSVDPKSYSLRSGESSELKVWYKPTAEGTNRQSVLVTGGSTATVPVTGSARQPPQPPKKVRFTGPADFVAQYYSDTNSWVLKPLQTEGPFLKVCDRPLLLALARQQEGREKAVIALPSYPTLESEETNKVAWANDLKTLGYQRVVFLRSLPTTNIYKMFLLDDPQTPGAQEPGPVIAVSPAVLDFGLIGVNRTKDLTLTVRNVGGGTLNGMAIVAAPFSVAGNTYSLPSGQSQSLTVQYKPTAEATNSQSLVFSGANTATVLVTGSARIPPQPPGSARITSTTTD